MKTLYQSLILTLGALALAGSAYGQQPPDVVNSDKYYNTAMGTGALMSEGQNCDAPPGCSDYNTAAGYQALYSNAGGAQNTAVGAQALYFATAGYPPYTLALVPPDANTAVGYQALYSNQYGGANTAVGDQALYSNNYWASGNTAVGFQALYSSTVTFSDGVFSVGEYNTALGVQALYGANVSGVANLTGSYNTASGYGALYGDSTGSDNAAYGALALRANTTGNNNTASGYQALYSNTTGGYNTASGTGALYANTIGYDNVASGAYALGSNTTGSYNTASGTDALALNTTGGYNTASGYEALQTNTTGNGNSAVGFSALFQNTTGDYNTAVGYDTLYSNTTGTENNAAGYAALHANTTGSYNNAMGVEALYENTTGAQNSAVGYGALYSNTSGNYNAAFGYFAGFDLTTGSNNIDINNRGVAGESAVTRIGVQGTQVATYIAGIYGTSVTGSAVVVSSTGQLGVTVSSERFKTAITPMGSNSEKLQQLRPVTFHLKTDPDGALQYGLIAEEVAKVYPELVIRDEKGRIDGVRYDELAPMLLNEAQGQRRIIAKQADKITAQALQLRDVQRQLAAMQAAFAKLQTNKNVVAER